MRDSKTGAQRRHALSETAVRVLRAIIENQPEDGSGIHGAACLVSAAGSERRLYDALLLLDSRWLIRWERGGQNIRPRAAAYSLLRQAFYRDRGITHGRG
jgi:hypothetical protein